MQLLSVGFLPLYDFLFTGFKVTSEL